MRSRIVARPLMLGGSLALGLAVGTSVVALAEGRPADTKAPFVSERRPQLEKFEVLGDGSTAGNWTPETPLAERPDFLPVKLKGGEVGYIKRSDMFDVPYVDPSGEVSEGTTRAQFDATIRAHEALAARANAKGELWAPVYAHDGESIVGTKLVAEGVE